MRPKHNLPNLHRYGVSRSIRVHLVNLSHDRVVPWFEAHLAHLVNPFSGHHHLSRNGYRSNLQELSRKSKILVLSSTLSIHDDWRAAGSHHSMIGYSTRGGRQAHTTYKWGQHCLYKPLSYTLQDMKHSSLVGAQLVIAPRSQNIAQDCCLRPQHSSAYCNKL